MKINFSATARSRDILAFNSGNIAELGFLSEAELSVFSKLIRNRRSLPVYRDGYWACYECPFESDDLGAMAIHILRAHKPAPLSDDEMLDEVCLELG
jgi:hypothetical protein